MNDSAGFDVFFASIGSQLTSVLSSLVQRIGDLEEELKDVQSKFPGIEDNFVNLGRGMDQIASNQEKEYKALDGRIETLSYNVSGIEMQTLKKNKSKKEVKHEGIQLKSVALSSRRSSRTSSDIDVALSARSLTDSFVASRGLQPTTRPSSPLAKKVVVPSLESDYDKIESNENHDSFSIPQIEVQPDTVQTENNNDNVTAVLVDELVSNDDSASVKESTPTLSSLKSDESIPSSLHLVEESNDLSSEDSNENENENPIDTTNASSPSGIESNLNLQPIIETKTELEIQSQAEIDQTEECPTPSENTDSSPSIKSEVESVDPNQNENEVNTVESNNNNVASGNKDTNAAKNNEVSNIDNHNEDDTDDESDTDCGDDTDDESANDNKEVSNKTTNDHIKQQPPKRRMSVLEAAKIGASVSKGPALFQKRGSMLWAKAVSAVFEDIQRTKLKPEQTIRKRIEQLEVFMKSAKGREAALLDRLQTMQIPVSNKGLETEVDNLRLRINELSDTFANANELVVTPREDIISADELEQIMERISTLEEETLKIREENEELKTQLTKAVEEVDKLAAAPKHVPKPPSPKPVIVSNNDDVAAVLEEATSLVNKVRRELSVEWKGSLAAHHSQLMDSIKEQTKEAAKTTADVKNLHAQLNLSATKQELAELEDRLPTVDMIKQLKKEISTLKETTNGLEEHKCDKMEFEILRQLVHPEKVEELLALKADDTKVAEFFEMLRKRCDELEDMIMSVRDIDLKRSEYITTSKVKDTRDETIDMFDTIQSQIKSLDFAQVPPADHAMGSQESDWKVRGLFEKIELLNDRVQQSAITPGDIYRLRTELRNKVDRSELNNMSSIFVPVNSTPMEASETGAAGRVPLRCLSCNAPLKNHKSINRFVATNALRPNTTTPSGLPHPANRAGALRPLGKRTAQRLKQPNLHAVNSMESKLYQSQKIMGKHGQR